MATSDGMKDPPNVDPHEDWELNTFLLEVSEMLEEEDLEKMKSLCKGEGGIGRAVLERVTSPLDFFDLLRQNERLTRHNLLFLQALIWSVGRKDIHKKFVEFGREMKETLHFFAPKDTPENGYKYLKFHVGGDTKNYRTESMRNLQAHVARLLRVPVEFVFICGIEPSSSLLITFMVPEDIVYVIHELTEDEKRGFLLYDIDSIVAEEKIISLKGELPTDVLNDDLESKKLLEKKLKQEKEIGSLQMKLFEANKALKELRNNISNEQAGMWILWLSFLYNLHCASERSRVSQRVPNSNMLAAQTLQKRMLRKCRQLGYEENIICDLLDANTAIHTAKEDILTISLLQMMNKLRNDNCLLQYQLDKLLFYCKMKEDERLLNETEEFFLSQMFWGHSIELNIQIDEPLDNEFVIGVLGTLSKAMTTTERSKILSNHRLSPKEISFLEANPEQLLLTLLRKEKAAVNISAWLQKILHPLGNQKLQQKAFKLINAHTSKDEFSQHRRESASSDGSDIHKPTEKHGKGSSGAKTAGRQTTTSKSKTEERPNSGEEQNKKLDKILHIMSAMQEDVAVLKLKNDPFSSLSFLKNERKFPELFTKDTFPNSNV